MKTFFKKSQFSFTTGPNISLLMQDSLKRGAYSISELRITHRVIFIIVKFEFVSETALKHFRIKAKKIYIYMHDKNFKFG